MVKMTSHTWLANVRPVCRPNVFSGRPQPFTAAAPAPRGWTEPLRIIYEHEVVLFRGACFMYEVHGQRTMCEENSFAIVPPGQWHVSWNAASRAGYRYWCHFDWEPCGGWDDHPTMTFHPAKMLAGIAHMPPAYVPAGMLYGRINGPQRAFDLMERLISRHASTNPHDRFVSRALLLELLLELLDDGPRASEKSDLEIGLASQVRSILERVAAEGGEELRLRPALEATGFSYEYALRVFRSVYGLTPNSFVHALRIERAKLLLRDTDQPIGKVAGRVGIHDAAYFSELFRRYTGVLPSEFRQQCIR